MARSINDTGLSFAQACEISDFKRLVFVSGQIPEDDTGHVPADFDGQCRLIWKNTEKQLIATGMSLGNLVKVTTFLSDRRWREDNRRIRIEVLGDARRR